MGLPQVCEDPNPMMTDDGRHVATARIEFVNGVLHQLFWPCDTAADDPEWRPVPDFSDPRPAPF